MEIDELYNFMKEKLNRMYEEDEKTVNMTQAEFFHLYKAICDMMHIKHIMEVQ